MIIRRAVLAKICAELRIYRVPTLAMPYYLMVRKASVTLALYSSLP